MEAHGAAFGLGNCIRSHCRPCHVHDSDLLHAAAMLAMQRQLALANWAPTMNIQRGITFLVVIDAGKVDADKVIKREAMVKNVPQLAVLPAALEDLFGEGKVPGSVKLHRALGLPRYEGVADVIRSHPRVFGREACAALDDVAVQTTYKSKDGDTVEVGYAQVGDMGGVERHTCQ